MCPSWLNIFQEEERICPHLLLLWMSLNQDQALVLIPQSLNKTLVQMRALTKFIQMKKTHVTRMKFWTTFAEWMTQLDRDDHRSLVVTGNISCFKTIFYAMYASNRSSSAQLVASIVGRADKTVRRWRTGLIKNKGKLQTSSKQGRFVREGVLCCGVVVLWKNEELSEKVCTKQFNNSSVKGKPNMTTHDF